MLRAGRTVPFKGRRESEDLYSALRETFVKSSIEKRDSICYSGYGCKNTVYREETPLRKKSHILLAGYLADQLIDSDSLQLHRKAFCLGNILPDCKPSFLTTRHEFFGTFGSIQERIRFLVLNGTEVFSESALWRKIGEVMHYIADYFTFPHNKTFTGGFRDHNQYEKELKNRLKQYIKSGDAYLNAVEETMIRFQDLGDLIAYVQTRHECYLKRERTISEDIQYILSVCLQVVHGIFQLCTEYHSDRVSLV